MTRLINTMAAITCPAWDNSNCVRSVHCPPRCPRFVDDEETPVLIRPHGPDRRDAVLAMYDAIGVRRLRSTRLSESQIGSELLDHGVVRADDRDHDELNLTVSKDRPRRSSSTRRWGSTCPTSIGSTSRCDCRWRAAGNGGPTTAGRSRLIPPPVPRSRLAPPRGPRSLIGNVGRRL